MDLKKFFSFVPFDTALADVDGDDVLVEIEMLRVGRFNHPRYGELDITLDFLQSLVENYDNNVLQRDVSFDWNHERKEASAWLRGLTVVDDVLVGTVEFTPKGKESVENGEYGYFSVEYDDDYEDSETGDTFGPALIGGALTNRPFISGLKRIEFEAPDDDSITLFQLKEGKMPRPKKKEPPVKREPALTEEELRKQLEESTDTIKELKDQISSLEGRLENDGDDDNGLEELRGLLNTQKETIKTLTETVKNLEEDNKKSATEARRLKVDALCDKMITEEGHHRGVVEVAKEIMLASNPNKKIVTLSETHGEGDSAKTVEVECTMDDAITKLMEAIPAEQRADFTERTRTKPAGEVEEEAEEVGIMRAFDKLGMKRKSLESKEKKRQAAA